MKDSRPAVLLHHWPAPYEAIKTGDQAVAKRNLPGDYTPHLATIMKFFQSKIPPLRPAETLEIYTFMEAADESKRRGGASVDVPRL